MGDSVGHPFRGNQWTVYGVHPGNPQSYVTTADGGARVENGVTVSRGDYLKPKGRDLNNLKWVKPRRAKYEAMVEVDVKKLDELWKLDGPQWRIDEHGSNQIGDRLKRFGEWLDSTDEPIETPEISFTERGSVAFTNGRHRFAYLRDKGVKTVMVSIPRREAERLRKAAGR